MISTTTCPYCQVAQRTFSQLGTQTKVVQLNKVQDGNEIFQQVKEKTGEKTVRKN